MRALLPECFGVRTQWDRAQKSLRRVVTRVTKGDIRGKIPLDGEQFVGGGEFVEIGNRVFQLFQAHCGLLPQDVILDVGSGQGRIARPLVDFLCPDQGEYHGIEIIEEGVEFCRKAYSDYENFSFHHIPESRPLSYGRLFKSTVFNAVRIRASEPGATHSHTLLKPSSKSDSVGI